MLNLLLLVCIAVISLSTNVSARDHSSPLNPMVVYITPPSSNSFLGLIEQGIEKAQHELGINVSQTVVNHSDYMDTVRDAVENKYDPILAVYASSTPNLENFVKSHPGTRFIAYDISYDASNSIGILFDNRHSAYIMGYLAAIKTQTGKVGFIGGVDSAPINNFLCGFELGIESVNKEVEVDIAYIGKSHSAWTDKHTASEIASKMLYEGADIIFPVAGEASIGVYDVIKAHGGMAFGVDTDKSAQYSNVILASMIKHVDKATYAVLKQLHLGIWNSNHKHFGVSQNMVDVVLNPKHTLITDSDMELIRKLSDEMKMPASKPLQRLNKHCNRHL